MTLTIETHGLGYDSTNRPTSGDVHGQIGCRKKWIGTTLSSLWNTPPVKQLIYGLTTEIDPKTIIYVKLDV